MKDKPELKIGDCVELLPPYSDKKSELKELYGDDVFIGESGNGNVTIIHNYNVVKEKFNKAWAELVAAHREGK